MIPRLVLRSAARHWAGWVPARASASARTTSGSRGSGGRTSGQGRSRRTPGRRIRICCTVSHLLNQPPICEGRWRVARPAGPALRRTVRIPVAVGRHPNVHAGWNIGARRVLPPRCYRAAAGWHEERGLADDAIRHALAAGDPAWAARLIERYFDAVFLTGERATVQRWLAALPAELGADRSAVRQRLSLPRASRPGSRSGIDL